MMNFWKEWCRNIISSSEEGKWKVSRDLRHYKIGKERILMSFVVYVLVSSLKMLKCVHKHRTSYLNYIFLNVTAFWDWAKWPWLPWDYICRIVMSFYNGLFLWAFPTSDTFWYTGNFPMMRGFCGCMNICEPIGLFIYKAMKYSLCHQAVYLLTMLYHKKDLWYR